MTALLLQELDVPGTTSTLLAMLIDPALIAQPGGAYTPIDPGQLPGPVPRDPTARQGRHGRAAAAPREGRPRLAARQRVRVRRPRPAQPPGRRAPSRRSRSRRCSRPRSSSSSTAPSARRARGRDRRTSTTLIAEVAAGTIATDAEASDRARDDHRLGRRRRRARSPPRSVLTFPADYTRPATYDALRTLEAMLTATGASGAQLAAFGASDPDASTAAAAQGVLRSRYSGGRLARRRPHGSSTRSGERRSAALQAYLLAQRDSGGSTRVRRHERALRPLPDRRRR